LDLSASKWGKVMKQIIQALRLFIILTVLTGAVYPLAVTVLGQAAFSRQANGSLIKKDGKILGSELLAQNFQSDRYFWPRPSAGDFATTPSGASHQGPTNAALKQTISKRAEFFKGSNGLAANVTLPSDILFASASGLDPHISPEAARLQADRIARARNFDAKRRRRLNEWVDRYTEQPQFGIFGEPRVNVFCLNLALDSL
jgi:K+-transporting ATPase ATPase C chain